MSSGYVVPIDPNDFSRFVSYDARYDDAQFDSEDDTLTEEELEELSSLEQDMRDLLSAEGHHPRLSSLLERIPPREADIIELYFFHEKRQADIAAIFNITQAAVSYRLGRGILRVKFLLDIPDVTVEQMREDLSEAFPGTPSLMSDDDPDADLHIDARILIHMWMSTCQSEVAKTLNLTQGRVRHRFFKAVDRLQELAKENPKFEPYSTIFSKISSKKFNILREVKLPQWSDRGGNELL